MLQWELQATQSFPSPLIEADEKKSLIVLGLEGEEAGPLGVSFQIHADITSCLSRRGYGLIPGHMCQCPTGRLWSWVPTALLLPQGQIQVKAITSLRLKLLNPLHQRPQMLLAALWPLTCPMRPEKKNIKPPVIHSCGGTNSSMTLKQRVIWKQVS